MPALRLEVFDTVTAGDGAPRPLVEASALDEAKVASFEQGYSAGWEDAAAAQEGDQTRIRADLARNRSELAKATILAPFSGTVFKVYAHPGDKVGDDGILDIGDSSRMGVIAEVYQTDRPGIALGQRAVISAEGFPGRQMSGTVVEIARQVSRQTVFTGEAGENLDRRVVEVKIGLGPEATAIASTINYLQVNVLFEPLSDALKQQQRQRQEALIREQSGAAPAGAR